MIDFPSSFFVKNRQKLAKLAEADLIVVTANGQLQRNGDNVFKFRQDSNFWYLTGINLPDVILVMDVSNKTEWLILPARSEYEVIFEGEVADVALADQSGVEEILHNQTGWKRLSERLKQRPVVATMQAPPAYLSPYNVYTNPARRALIDKLTENKVRNFVDLRETLALMRQVKQQVEIEAIRTAVDITVQTFLEDVIPNLSKATRENELEALLTAGYRARGADGHSFDPIVSSGKTTCILHYQANNAKLPLNEFVLLDTGAEVNNYAADITRTFTRGKPSHRHRQVYEAVYAAQQAAIAAIKPGSTFRKIDSIANGLLKESLKQLGLKPLGDKNLLRSYYPHAWHWLGLDVHDAGDYERKFKAGMVLTVEPGIYILAEGIGVRIEDDVLVTKDGHEVLSAALPSDPRYVFSRN